MPKACFSSNYSVSQPVPPAGKFSFYGIIVPQFFRRFLHKMMKDFLNICEGAEDAQSVSIYSGSSSSSSVSTSIGTSFCVTCTCTWVPSADSAGMLSAHTPSASPAETTCPSCTRTSSMPQYDEVRPLLCVSVTQVPYRPSSAICCTVIFALTFRKILKKREQT